MRLLPYRRVTSRIRSPMLPSVTAVAGAPFAVTGFVVGWSLGPAEYGWCAHASKVFRPAFFPARSNASGETDGRALFGLLFPRGAVTPQPTRSPGASVAWMPL